MFPAGAARPREEEAPRRAIAGRPDPGTEHLQADGTIQAVGGVSLPEDRREGEPGNPFGARRFIETRDEEYDVIVKYAGDINLNLSTYDYRND
jgi:hypothetical protein